MRLIGINFALIVLAAMSVSAIAPVWYLNHTFTDSVRLFEPSLRGYHCMVQGDQVYYHDAFFNEWMPSGGGHNSYSHLRMYGTGAINQFAGTLAVGSFSDGIWRWSGTADPVVEEYLLLPTLFDVYPMGNVWILGGNPPPGGPEVRVKYPATGWSDPLTAFASYPPICGYILTPDTILILTGTALARSTDGGLTWHMLLESVLATDTYSPSDMAVDEATRTTYLGTWGALLTVDRTGTITSYDARAGHGYDQVRLVGYGGNTWIMAQMGDGSLKARRTDDTLWFDWSAALPGGSILGFGARSATGAAVLMTNGNIYFSDSLTGATLVTNPPPDPSVIRAVPNPCTDHCRIEGPAGLPIRIVDVSGNTVYNGRLPLDWLPDQSITAGIYWIQSLPAGQAPKRLILLR